MRVLLIAVALAVSTLPLGADPGKPAPGNSGIAWEAAYDAAKAKAAGEGKLLFVDFLTDG
ncbi:MAG: hypothetical protein HYY18_19515 [Planctomycetes bacterium]|nr:hypothetical protein [Planctomycetota bacterium]